MLRYYYCHLEYQEEYIYLKVYNKNIKNNIIAGIIVVVSALISIGALEFPALGSGSSIFGTTS